MFIFAHEGVDHSTNIETATHNWPSLLTLGLVTIGLLALVYWLLSYKLNTSAEENEK